MATSVEYAWGISGQTVTGQFWLDGSGDVVPAATLTLIECANRPGYYRVSTGLTGLYEVRILINGTAFDTLWVNIPSSGSAVLESSRSIANRQPASYTPPPINPIQVA